MIIHQDPPRTSRNRLLGDLPSDKSHLDSIRKADVDVLRSLPDCVQSAASLTTPVAPPLAFISRASFLLHHQGSLVVFSNEVLLTTTGLEGVNQ